MAAPPALQCFDIFVCRDFDSSDNTQVPAAGWVVDLFRQGATVAEQAYVPSGANGPLLVDLSVFHVGAAAVGDRLWVNADALVELEVARVDVVNNVIEVFNGTDTDITVNPMDRLIDSTNPPLLYSRPLATSPVQAPFQVDSMGRLHGYVAPFRFDYVIRMPHNQSRIFPDAEGSYPMR